MVAAARRESERLGLANVEHREMDAERIDLADSSVDGVLCRWGYMLMADPAAALAETRRVLRDGGRLSLSVWGAAERNPWASVPARALMEHTGAPAPNPEDPGIFAMADPERVSSLLRDAGFGEPRLEEVEVSWRFERFADYWRYVTQMAGGIAMVLQAMPEADREAVRSLVERSAGAFQVNGALELPGVALNASAG
jgi:ubiquinone/menaquinone biosynthesis C-methylase UbiE